MCQINLSKLLGGDSWIVKKMNTDLASYGGAVGLQAIVQNFDVIDR